MEILIKILIIILEIGIIGLISYLAYILLFVSIRHLFSEIINNEKNDPKDYKDILLKDKNLKNKKEENIFKYIEPKLESIKYLKFYPMPTKFECGTYILDRINLAEIEKKKENYSKAYKIYKYILDIDGPSGVLYVSWAKLLMCKEHWPEALYLFKIANEIYYREYNIYNSNYLFHIDMIKNLYNKEFYEVYDYMKKISKNDNYRFPKDGDIAKKLKLLIELEKM